MNHRRSQSLVMGSSRVRVLVLCLGLLLVLFGFSKFIVNKDLVNEIAIVDENIQKLVTKSNYDRLSTAVAKLHSRVATPTVVDYVIPTDDVIANMDENSMMQVYWKYINRLQILCRDIIRVGSLKDGGKEICIDEPYKPAAPCIVYSFGINYLWDFDNAMVNKFGCDIFCFDPSMKNDTQRISEHIWFYKWGLGGENKVNGLQWNIKTLDKIRAELGHQNKTIDLLKIDIEGDEWAAIPQMISSGALDDVKQISMETHFSRERPNVPKYWGRTRPDLHLRSLRQLYEFGFRIFIRERNLWSHFKWPTFNDYITNVNEISLIKPKS